MLDGGKETGVLTQNDGSDNHRDSYPQQLNLQVDVTALDGRRIR